MATTVGTFVSLCVLTGIAFACYWVVWHSRRSRDYVRKWAERSGLVLKDVRYRLGVFGPFFCMSNMQAVYRITVTDGDGHLRKGWVRVGSWFWLTDEVEVLWDSDMGNHAVRKHAILGALSSLRRRPVIVMVSIAAFIVMFLCFFSAMSFVNALSPEEALEKWNKPLPAGWTAGVMNHGEYYRWWRICERPVFFSVSLAGLIASVAWLWTVTLWAWIRRRRRGM